MAAVDYFLKIDGIDGESTDSKHKNEIDVESWSWGETNTGFAGGGGGGAGKVQMQDFHFVIKVNKASPKLFVACASGQHLKDAVLTARRDNLASKERGEFLKWTLEDVIVTSYQTGGSGGDALPVDSFSLNFAAIKFEYKEQKADGSLGDGVEAGWDLRKNTKR